MQAHSGPAHEPETAPQAAPAEDMTLHGYAFLAFAAVVIAGLVWAAIGTYQSIGLGGCIAVALAARLALWGRLRAG